MESEMTWEDVTFRPSLAVYEKSVAERYKAENEFHSQTKWEFISGNIFNFSLCDSDADELFGRWAVRVAEAITNGTTYDFIKQVEHYKWFLIMVNMPFFADRIEWGGSIRGAWWDISVGACPDWWGDYIKEVIEFAKEA